MGGSMVSTAVATERAGQFIQWIRAKDFDRVKAAMDEGWDINVPDASRKWPLYIATIDVQTESVIELIDKGASVKAVGSTGNTLLYAAIDQLQPELIKKLIAHPDCDINATNDNGITALVAAAARRKKDICKDLLVAGAAPNICNEHGLTALYYAAKFTDHELCEILLQHGANPNLGNITTLPLIEMVNRNDYTGAQLLVRHGADRSILSQEQNTWLETLMRAEIEHRFSTTGDVREQFLKDGKPTETLLNICALNEFDTAIANPLLNSGDKEDLALLKEIYAALPQCWKHQNKGFLAQAAKAEKTVANIDLGKGEIQHG